MPRLVANDQIEQLLEHRVVGFAASHVERGQGETFQDDLHADELQVPALVGEDLVEEILQALGDGIGETDLGLQVAVEHLHMTGLVKGLGSRVELGVEAGSAGGQLGCHQQRALLTVQELGQRPSVFVLQVLDLAL